MTELSASPHQPTRYKLGLALAGGGFRASLFHVGVLRRLAELDLLRYVEVLSTVSGGSVVGALYLMHLKAELEQPMLAQLPPRLGGLSRYAYLQLVRRVEQDMRRAAQLNLRTRLLMHPWTLLKVCLGPDSLATAMAKLYDEHLLKGVAQRLRSTTGQPESDRLPLLALRLRAEASSRAGGSENYNHQALWEGAADAKPGSALTRWIINATSLNSGARFWFSHAELGEWYFGHLRYGEIETELLPRKVLLYPEDTALKPRVTLSPKDKAWAESVLSVWSRSDASGLRKRCRALQTLMDQVAPGVTLETLVQWLSDAESGRLRALKTPAWFLLRGRRLRPKVTDGLSLSQHVASLREAFFSLLPDGQRDSQFNWDQLRALHPMRLARAQQQACRLILEIYNLRAAWMVSPQASQEWQRLPLAQAVTASAAFPPVFPPYLLSDFYDDRRVRTLGLTDGGVFDNMGTTALLDEQCNLIIASDPGGIFETEQQEASVGRLGLSARLTAILSELPLNLFRHELRERVRLTERLAGESLGSTAKEFLSLRALKVLINFRIDSGVPLLRGRQMLEERAPGERPPEPALTLAQADERERRLLARLRTDLDAFSDLEAEALIRHGYLQAEENLAPLRQAGSPLEHHPGWQHEAAVPYEPPFRDEAAMRRRERLLRAGRHRFLRLLAAGGEGWRPAIQGLGLLVLLFGLSRDGLWQWVSNAGLPWVQEAWQQAKPSALRWCTERLGAWLPWTLVVLIFGPGALWRWRSADRARRREFGLPPPSPWPLQAWWRSYMPTVWRNLRYYRNTWLYPSLVLLLPMNWALWALLATATLIVAVPLLACLADACFSKPLLLLARRGTGVQGIPDSYP
ncbi:patatin-like phospholipase family protein [Kinneretia aquatilis]|uniref:patatin-like phospholipase family protein n=1 Tax=Kinneretia aquatilis TaxID=2070761 RepID=UPI0014951FB2|nr:patatin-like phospholipase family protein [Paucibacter aquatile]WIV97581.1 patatin-like phospholipase family protein [Paucibacter aquatile]